jgi:hypothetical protein
MEGNFGYVGLCGICTGSLSFLGIVDLYRPVYLDVHDLFFVYKIIYKFETETISSLRHGVTLIVSHRATALYAPHYMSS